MYSIIRSRLAAAHRMQLMEWPMGHLWGMLQGRLRTLFIGYVRRSHMAQLRPLLMRLLMQTAMGQLMVLLVGWLVALLVCLHDPWSPRR